MCRYHDTCYGHFRYVILKIPGGVYEREKTREDAAPYLNDDGFDFAKAPAELSRRLILHETRHYLTVVDAQILAPGQPAATRVPVMRVAVAEVSGWWIVPLDKNGNASLQLWTGDQQER